MIFVSHVAYVAGWVPTVSLGYATVESVVKLQDAVTAIQINQLIAAIERERRNVCVSLYSGNKAALDYAVRKRDELLRDYRALTGEDLPPVTCKELGVE